MMIPVSVPYFGYFFSFLFLFYTHFLYFSWACSSLALWLGKLSQVTDYCWGLKTQSEFYSHWSLLWCSKTHFHPMPSSMELKVHKQLYSNWSISSSEKTGELGWIRCGKIPRNKCSLHKRTSRCRYYGAELISLEAHAVSLVLPSPNLLWPWPSHLVSMALILSHIKWKMAGQYKSITSF